MLCVSCLLPQQSHDDHGPAKVSKQEIPLWFERMEEHSGCNDDESRAY
jgi:hypothetical protein